MADNTIQLSPGDYVRVIKGAYASEFGYVVSQTEDICSIAVDQWFAPVEEFPLPAVINCPSDDLKRIVRRQEQNVSLDVKDYVHQSFPVYGVAASKWAREENNNVMDPKSAFGPLHRPTIAELPPPHTVDSIFSDQDVKELYLRLFRGEYSILWRHAFHDAEAIRTGRPMIQFGVSDRASNGMYSALMHCYTFMPAEKGTVVTSYCQPTHDELPGLSENQRKALNARIVHHFLRLAGVDLGFWIRLLLAKSMSVTYQLKKWWIEALDMAIVSADMAVVTKEPCVFPQPYLYTVAKALMACKSFLIAAEILEQASETTADFGDKTFAEQAKARRLAGSFDQAEHCLFIIFRLSYAELRGNLIIAPIYAVLIQEVCTTYVLRISADFVTGSPWTLTSKVCYLLCALTGVSCGSDRVGSFIGSLDKKYRKAQTAKSKLFATFQLAAAQETCRSGTEAFRTGIHSVLKKGFRFENIGFDPCIFSKFLEKSKTWKSETQKTQIDEAEKAASIPCGNDSCRFNSTEKRMERCASCQDILYCSRGCQEAHWPEHKTRCKLVAKALKSAAS